MLFKPVSHQNLISVSRRFLSYLRDRYGFVSPPSLRPEDQNPNHSSEPGSYSSKKKKKTKPPYKPPSSLDRTGKNPVHSDLPFDFRFSYTESNPATKPIGLREPKYSPFGPNAVDRVWTGVCAPAVDPTVSSVDGKAPETVDEEEAKRRRLRILGEPLTLAERSFLIEQCQKQKTKRQVNLGRDGLTHNMLNDIHNNWKHAEAIRIKCLGVPTVDMKNVCTQLEAMHLCDGYPGNLPCTLVGFVPSDINRRPMVCMAACSLLIGGIDLTYEKTGGLIIHRHGGRIILYRGRHYNPKKRPVIPLMLWKPHEPIYPRLIKTVIEGFTIEETKEMRKKGLSVPPLTKLAKNGYYDSLVPMVRDAFLTDELVRIDCKWLPKSDYSKIGVKLRDLVPCVLVTFQKEQIVLWRGKNYSSTSRQNSEVKSFPQILESDDDAKTNSSSLDWSSNNSLSDQISNPSDSDHCLGSSFLAETQIANVSS